MSKGSWRFIITGIAIVLSIYAFWPTFRLWTMSDSDKQTLQTNDPGALMSLKQKAIRPGLDLQGGIHVVLRVKLEELDEASRKDAVERAIQVIRNRVDGLGVAEPLILKQGEDRIVVDLPGYTDADRAEELIGQTALLEFKFLESYENASLIMNRIDSVLKATGKAGTVKPATTETAKSESGGSDVMKELMGDSAKEGDDFAFDEAAATTDDKPFSGKLEPSLGNNRTNTNWPGFTVSKREREQIDIWLALPEIQALTPVDVQWCWSTRPEIRQSREVYMLYLVKRKVQFVGRYLESVALGRDNLQGFAVDFSLSGEGDARFAQLTGANIDKPLAIVLDDRVESAPFITSKIRGRGQITMGSSASMEEARNLEIVLKAGSLPAPVEIIEKNVIGATLGTDSINKGFYSSMAGLILVLLFIGIYYRISGWIANLGLLFNIFFLLAVLAGFGATLTMPGIAGIILTIGISVDANILIFERIREEMRTGKPVRAAIDAGYDRAWLTIWDSHVTTLITAGALFILGSGPVKGFAVTLFWGVSISLFTAYVITKMVFDLRKQYTSLSI
ncbi:MAG: protein translocase subunit SecD [Candidatus Zixiibacteriota bacterium]